MLQDRHLQLNGEFHHWKQDRLVSPVIVIEFDADESAVLDTTPHFVERCFAVARIDGTVTEHASREPPYSFECPGIGSNAAVVRHRAFRRQRGAAQLIDAEFVGGGDEEPVAPRIAAPQMIVGIDDASRRLRQRRGCCGEHIGAVYCVDLFRGVGGAPIIWGLQPVVGFRRRHVGASIHEAWHDSLTEIAGHLDAGLDADRTRLLRATSQELGSSRQAVLDTVTQRLDLSQKVAGEAYDVAATTESNPRSVWGYVQGLTRLSQRLPWQDQRFALDQAASRLLATVD